jgi:hypothetical protein
MVQQSAQCVARKAYTAKSSYDSTRNSTSDELAAQKIELCAALCTMHYGLDDQLKWLADSSDVAS